MRVMPRIMDIMAPLLLYAIITAIYGTDFCVGGRRMKKHQQHQRHQQLRGADVSNEFDTAQSQRSHGKGQKSRHHHKNNVTKHDLKHNKLIRQQEKDSFGKILIIIYWYQ